MFEFFKRKKPAALSGGGGPPLFFKDGTAALQYACKSMECPLHEGSCLPAVVLDSRELLGIPTAVKIQADGNQRAILRVASDDGGFLVAASTAGTEGPELHPGQLVAWMAIKHEPDIAKTAKDKRVSWVGVIIATLKPEHRNGNWIGDEKFSS